MKYKELYHTKTPILEKKLKTKKLLGEPSEGAIMDNWGEHLTSIMQSYRSTTTGSFLHNGVITFDPSASDTMCTIREVKAKLDNW